MNREYQLNNLLNSSSRYEYESQDGSLYYNSNRNTTNQKNSTYNMRETNLGRNNHNFELDDQQQSFHQQENMKAFFPLMNGPSVQIQQNSFMASGKDDSRFDKFPPLNNRKDLENILLNKKKQQDKVNEVLEKQLKQLTNQIQTKIQIIEGLNTHVDGLEKKIIDLKRQLQKKEQNQNIFHLKIKQLEQHNEELYMLLTSKDKIFNELKQTLRESALQLQNKQRQLKLLEDQKQSLQTNLQMYSNNDRQLMNFKSVTPKHKGKQYQTIRKQKLNLETELTIIKSKLETSQQNLNIIERQNKDRLEKKERKIKELEEKCQEIMDQMKKIKKNNESTLQSQKKNNYTITKQVKEKQDKIIQLENRLKTVHQTSKKTEQNVCELHNELNDKIRACQQLTKTIQQLKNKCKLDQKQIQQQKSIIEKLQKIIQTMKQDRQNLQRTNAGTENKYKKQNEILKRQIENIKKDINKLQKDNQKIEKQKNQKDIQYKEVKKKYQESVKEQKRKLEDHGKKQMSENTKIQHLESILSQREQELNKHKNVIEKLNKQVYESRKKAQTNIQLANKLMILQSRLSRQQPEYDSFNQQEKDQVYQQILQQKDHQIRQLKMNRIQFDKYEQQLIEKQEIIENLERELEFKEKSIQFMHNKFLEAQRQKIQMEAQKKALHSSFYDTSYTDCHQQMQQMKNHYEEAINNLTGKLESYQQKIKEYKKKLRQKDQGNKYHQNPQKDSKFQITQLKTRIKQLSQLLLDKQKSFTPQTLSQEQTVNFLIKVIKRCIRSHDMIRLLTVNYQFRECLGKIDRQLRK